MVCYTTWCSDGANPVSIALNGLSFAPSNGVEFSCIGLHKPALEHAHFPVAATSIVVRFDPQPTNRAGMNGLGPCATVLSDGTVATLRGASASDVLCDWRDDVTVEIFLSMFTDAAPGAQICVRAGALWPALYAGGCAADGHKCADEHCVAISEIYPCDDGLGAAGASRTECPTPTASIVGPSEISSCPDAKISLDGARSGGGGIKPLRFLWAPDRLSDNVLQIREALAPSYVAADTVGLQAELVGGAFFKVLLKVRSFYWFQFSFCHLCSYF